MNSAKTDTLAKTKKRILNYQKKKGKKDNFSAGLGP
jgi:hypothetical protein